MRSTRDDKRSITSTAASQSIITPTSTGTQQLRIGPTGSLSSTFATSVSSGSAITLAVSNGTIPITYILNECIIDNYSFHAEVIAL